MPRRRWLPDGVTEYKDRHGKARYRFRKAGLPTHHFSPAATPGTPLFLEELAAAQAATPKLLPMQDPASRHRPGSVAALAALMFASPGFRALSDAHQRNLRAILEPFVEKRADHPVKMVNAGHLDRILGKMADRPGAANNLRKSLGRLFRYAVKIGWRADNPVLATDKFPSGPGFHTWSEEEIAAFCAHWPYGSKPRLALELALNTAARRCNVVQLGRQHMVKGRFEFKHAKGGKAVSIPITQECRMAIDAMPVIGMETLLVTAYGKPFSAKGFGKWFKDQCQAAGLPNHCTIHGLRKAISRRLAESGSTSLQGRAVTGQSTDSVFRYYAEQADRTIMADAALANLAASNLANLPKPE